MWLVPQLTAFHQSQAEKSIPLGNTFGFRQLREQRLEKCGLCPITLHCSRPLIGGRQATVVQIYIYTHTNVSFNKGRAGGLVATLYIEPRSLMQSGEGPELMAECLLFC